MPGANASESIHRAPPYCQRSRALLPSTHGRFGTQVPSPERRPYLLAKDRCPMLRFLTAGESHGPSLTVILDGLPAGVPFTRSRIDDDLRRRQGGYGRGGRMKIERDTVEILSGVRHGHTLGSPLTLRIENRDWANWQEAMSADPIAEPTGVRDAGAAGACRPHWRAQIWPRRRARGDRAGKFARDGGAGGGGRCLSAAAGGVWRRDSQPRALRRRGRLCRPMARPMLARPMCSSGDGWRRRRCAAPMMR